MGAYHPSDLPAEEVALRYKELWRAERIFREAKNTLETRPIYHKYDSTILGHVFISFLALLIMHELKTRIDFHYEWDEIRQDLDALYEVEVSKMGELVSFVEKARCKVWRARS